MDGAIAMRKPDFFIVGAQRSGTSAMRDYLRKHPEIFTPKIGEPGFFATDGPWPRVIRDEKTYLSLFADAKDEKRVGEKSTRYLVSRRAAAEIKAFQPSASIIIMLRNPVDMVYSLHSHSLLFGREDITDFEAALAADEDRKRGMHLPKGGNPKDVRWFLYRERTRYTKQVQRYFDTFGRERVHVIIFDDFVRDTASVYRDTLKFLNVNPAFRPVFQKVNANRRVRSRVVARLLGNPPESFLLGSSRIVPFAEFNVLRRGLLSLNSECTPRPLMRPELRRELQAEFRPEIEQLSELLGSDLTHWCRPEAC